LKIVSRELEAGCWGGGIGNIAPPGSFRRRHHHHDGHQDP
jgi:hypothetical protein